MKGISRNEEALAQAVFTLTWKGSKGGTGLEIPKVETENRNRIRILRKGRKTSFSVRKSVQWRTSCVGFLFRR